MHTLCRCVALVHNSQHSFGLNLFCVIIIWFCSALFKAKLNSHRGDRLRRKVLTDLAEEDLKIKKRMLELMEDSARCNSNNMLQINTNTANIISTIQEGFSLMRELLFQRHFAHPHSSKGTHHHSCIWHRTSLHQPSCTHLGPVNQQTNVDITLLNNTHLGTWDTTALLQEDTEWLHCASLWCTVALYTIWPVAYNSSLTWSFIFQ